MVLLFQPFRRCVLVFLLAASSELGARDGAGSPDPAEFPTEGEQMRTRGCERSSCAELGSILGKGMARLALGMRTRMISG